jgi:NAD(P)-dependent dehydrogenase (short-subunit alcohol dehydrogenase family)
MRIEGKTALITGSGSGIGRATALLFSKEGAAIAVNDINLPGAQETVEMIKKQGGKAIAVKADVSEEKEVIAMVERTVKELGGVDILVNNAGMEGFGPIKDCTVENWDRVMAVNLRGNFLCAKHCGKWMMEHNHGKIVNVSSLAALRCPAGIIPYASAKAGIVRFTQTLALEWAPFHIYVNCIIPGGINTPMSRAHGPVNPERIKQLIPIGRIGEPEDVAKVALFYASSDSDFVSGTALPVDGGETARF